MRQFRLSRIVIKFLNVIRSLWTPAQLEFHELQISPFIPRHTRRHSEPVSFWHFLVHMHSIPSLAFIPPLNNFKSANTALEKSQPDQPPYNVCTASRNAVFVQQKLQKAALEKSNHPPLLLTLTHCYHPWKQVTVKISRMQIWMYCFHHRHKFQSTLKMCGLLPSLCIWLKGWFPRHRKRGRSILLQRQLQRFHFFELASMLKFVAQFDSGKADISFITMPGVFVTSY